MIRHAAIFRLNHPAGTAAEAAFLRDLAGLGAIAGVQAFDIAREVSARNPYHFAVSMQFGDQAAYDAYSADPLHVAFVQGRWIPDVAEFMEHDTISLG